MSGPGSAESTPEAAMPVRRLGGWRERIATFGEVGVLDWLMTSRPVSVTFERELRFYDARAVNNGTIAMYARDWRSSTNTAKAP